MSNIKFLSRLVKLNKKDYPFDLLIICFIALVVTLIWFREGRLIAWLESGFLFANPEGWVYHSFFNWWDVTGTGFYIAQVLPLIPHQSAMWVLKEIGFSEVFRQALTLFFLQAMSGISMYLLTKSLVSDETRRAASLTAGIVYMFTPYSLYVWNRFHSAIFFVPFVPLIVFLYLKGIKDKNNVWKNALCVNLALILPLAAFANPTYLQSCILIFSTIFCLYLLKNIGSRLRCFHAIKFSVVAGFLGMALYSWWFLPLIPNVSSSYQKASLIDPLSTLQAVSSQYYSSVYVIRGFDAYTYNWQLFHSNLFFTAITFFLPVLAFSALLFKQRDKHTLFFSLLALFGIFLCTGSEPPFGNVFVFLFKLIPFDAGFRAPGDKLGVILALSYSFLVGITLSSIYHRLANKFKKVSRCKKRSNHFAGILSLMIITITILPSAFPIFSGLVFEPGSTNDPVKARGAFVEVPDSYKKADEWLADQKDAFRVISFPTSPQDYLAYRWEHGYGGIDPWPIWSKTMIVGRTWETTVDSIIQLMEPNLFQSDQFWKTMAILNAKYAVVHNDFIGLRTEEPHNSSEYVKQLQRAEVPDYIDARSLLTQRIEVPDYTGALQLTTDVGNWKVARTPEHKITLDNTALIEGNSSVKITSHMEGEGNWEGGIQYEWKDTIDLSAYSLVSFWNKFESMDYIFRVYLELTDIHGDYKKWEITDQVTNAWTRIVIPLNSSGVWQSSDSLNLTSINTVRITFDKTMGSMKSTTWWIGGIQAVTTKNVEQELPVSSWKVVQVPEHTVVMDNTTSVDGQGSIKVTSYIKQEETWEGGVECKWSDVKDLSKYDFISFWIRFESMNYINRVYFVVADVHGDYKKWEITDQVTNAWTRIVIPLNSSALSQSSDDLDVSSINAVRITIEKKWGPMEPTTWWINGVQAVPAKVTEQMHISKSETFGDLVFFQVEDDFFLPLIHATNQYVFTYDIITMFNNFATSSVDPRNTTIFFLSQLSAKNLQFINNTQLAEKVPKLSFDKIDPTSYRVSVENATGPFFLVFSSTFDKNWVAYVDGWQTPAEYHFMANGYANAWYINKTGSYTITLEFWSQKLVYIGATISITTIIICVLFISKNKIITIYKRYLRKNENQISQTSHQTNKKNTHVFGWHFSRKRKNSMDELPSQ